MLTFQKLNEEIQDLENHFIERLDDGADSKELSSILNQIKFLKNKLNVACSGKLNAATKINMLSSSLQ